MQLLNIDHFCNSCVFLHKFVREDDLWTVQNNFHIFFSYVQYKRHWKLPTSERTKGPQKFFFILNSGFCYPSYMHPVFNRIPEPACNHIFSVLSSPVSPTLCKVGDLSITYLCFKVRKQWLRIQPLDLWTLLPYPPPSNLGLVHRLNMELNLQS